MQRKGGKKNWKGEFKNTWKSQRKKEIKNTINTKRMNEINEIICIYNKKEETINLLHDFNKDMKYYDEEIRKIYNETKNYMKDIYKKDIDIYINDKKIQFNTKYTSDETGEIKVKFIFHQILNNTSYMFSHCSSLESIDLSSFNTTNVTNMNSMFSFCSSLRKKYYKY